MEPGSVILNLNPSSSRWSDIDSITTKQEFKNVPSAGKMAAV